MTNDHIIYQLFKFQCLTKFTQFWTFALKAFHLATLHLGIKYIHTCMKHARLTCAHALNDLDAAAFADLKNKTRAAVTFKSSFMHTCTYLQRKHSELWKQEPQLCLCLLYISMYVCMYVWTYLSTKKTCTTVKTRVALMYIHSLVSTVERNFWKSRYVHQL
jgi:hypothetical protein